MDNIILDPYEKSFDTSSKSSLNTNEWVNIADVVKSTFQTMHHVITEQQEQMQQLKQQLKELQTENTTKNQEMTQHISKTIQQFRDDTFTPLSKKVQKLSTDIILYTCN